jgi:hypothetical protein
VAGDRERLGTGVHQNLRWQIGCGGFNRLETALLACRPNRRNHPFLDNLAHVLCAGSVRISRLRFRALKRRSDEPDLIPARKPRLPSSARPGVPVRQYSLSLWKPARAGGRIEWLGEHENLVFANTRLFNMTGEALENLVGGLTEAVGLLENGCARRAAPRMLARRWRALIASGGHTSDHRRAPKSSNGALLADARRRRAVQRRRSA